MLCLTPHCCFSFSDSLPKSKVLKRVVPQCPTLTMSAEENKCNLNNKTKLWRRSVCHRCRFHGMYDTTAWKPVYPWLLYLGRKMANGMVPYITTARLVLKDSILWLRSLPPCGWQKVGLKRSAELREASRRSISRRIWIETDLKASAVAKPENMVPTDGPRLLLRSVRVTCCRMTQLIRRIWSLFVEVCSLASARLILISHD